MGSTGRIAPVLTGGDELYFDSITDRGGVGVWCIDLVILISFYVSLVILLHGLLVNAFIPSVRRCTSRPNSTFSRHSVPL
jgi:hypothetical protein